MPKVEGINPIAAFLFIFPTMLLLTFIVWRSLTKPPAPPQQPPQTPAQPWDAEMEAIIAAQYQEEALQRQRAQRAILKDIERLEREYQEEQENDRRIF